MTGYDGGSVGMKEIWGKVANGRDLLGSVVDGVIVGATVVVEFRDGLMNVVWMCNKIGRAHV